MLVVEFCIISGINPKYWKLTASLQEVREERSLYISSFLRTGKTHTIKYFRQMPDGHWRSACICRSSILCTDLNSDEFPSTSAASVASDCYDFFIHDILWIPPPWAVTYARICLMENCMVRFWSMLAPTGTEGETGNKHFHRFMCKRSCYCSRAVKLITCNIIVNFTTSWELTWICIPSSRIDTALKPEQRKFMDFRRHFFFPRLLPCIKLLTETFFRG